MLARKYLFCFDFVFRRANEVLEVKPFEPTSKPRALSPEEASLINSHENFIKHMFAKRLADGSEQHTEDLTVDKPNSGVDTDHITPGPN
ncbi:MAG: hypothetical protein V2I33_20910 [Kangiellaceae bacterium]|nr:hypothetical protein [Kangiellaceae bacterium]